jgi:uncharacterized protein YceK
VNLRIPLILAATMALSGCAGLNVSWSATASYNTNAQTITQTQHFTSPANPK